MSNAGRIATYIHSDKSTANKGAAMIRLVCDTDFAAKTPDFVAFADRVAKLTYAAFANNFDDDESWEILVTVFPELEVERAELAAKLREKVSCDLIVVACL
jgi:translation elongation factor EF-Ts